LKRVRCQQAESRRKTAFLLPDRRAGAAGSVPKITLQRLTSLSRFFFLEIQ